MLTTLLILKGFLALGPRCLWCTGHEKAIEYIYSQFNKAGLKTYKQCFEYLNNKACNIIGEYLISKQAKYIVIGSHFDSRPWDDEAENPKNKPVLGANDGGSGCAIIMHIAYRLRSLAPKHNIRLICFDAHEQVPKSNPQGYFMGAKKYVNSLTKTQISSILVYININMIGQPNVKILKESASHEEYGKYVDKMWQVASDLGYNNYFLNKVTEYELLDDHSPFFEKGVPTIPLIDFSYPYRHTLEDTLDKISPTSLKIVEEVVVNYIKTL